jgi:hypothetical protein
MEMARRGFTASEIASHFGMSRRSLFYKLSRDRELHLAFTRGRADFKIILLQKLRENALKIGHRRSLVTLAKQFGIGVDKDREWPPWLG